MLVNIGNVGVQNSTFVEIQDSGAHRFGNTQKGISWPILDIFAPNLYAGKYGEYKGHERPIIALFENSRRRQHFCNSEWDGRHLEQEPNISVSGLLLYFTFYKTAYIIEELRAIN